MRQVILLNEYTEGRTIKLGLQPPEPCVDMGIISSFSEQSKHRQDCFLLLGNSGHLYAYDDRSIEKYLLQSQSKSSPSLPRDIMVKIPFVDSKITIAKFITQNTHMLSSADEVIGPFKIMYRNILLFSRLSLVWKVCNVVL